MLADDGIDLDRGDIQEETSASDQSGLTPDLSSDKTPVVSGTAHRVAMLRSIGMPPVKGDLRPIRQLGAGSFGEVWLVEEWVDNRPFRLLAVKFLHADKLGATSELFDEVEKLNPLTQKKGIVHVHHIEVEGDRPYFTMDYVDGGSLAAKIAVAPLPVDKAIVIFRQLAEALEAVHAKGIIHCDLKPENILLNAEHEPMVADFGQARLKGKGPPRPGSWFYMAPEQMELDSGEAETSCDIYALGAIFYKMVTGHEPRANAEAHESLRNVSSVREQLKIHRASILAAPKPVGHHTVHGMDRPLRSIIDRCLETDQSRRFRDGHEVLNALTQRLRSLTKRSLIKRGLLVTTVAMTALLVSLTVVVPKIFREHKQVYGMLIKDALERAAFLSRFASESIQDSLLELRQHATSWANDDVVRKFTRPVDKVALEGRLKSLFDEWRLDPDHLNDINLKGVAVLDETGYRLAALQLTPGGSVPPPEDQLSVQLWNWRDWFNGMGKDMVPGETPYPPISKPYISAPYMPIRKIVDDTPDQGGRLSFSAPIHDFSNPPKVIGILVFGVELMELYHNTPTVAREAVTRTSKENRELGSAFPITMFDNNGHLLIHFQNNKDFDDQFEPSDASLKFPCLIDGKVQMREPPNDRLRRSIPKRQDAYVKLLNEKRDSIATLRASSKSLGFSEVDDEKQPLTLADTQTYIPNFRDPIDHENEYNTVFTYMPKVGWGILFQQDRNKANGLIDELQTRLLWIGWVSFAVVLLVVSRLWWLILRRWWKEENFLNG